MIKAYYITLNKKHGPVIAEAWVSETEYKNDGVEIGQCHIAGWQLDMNLSRVKENLQILRDELGLTAELVAVK